jgi:hypothetical protein
MLHKSIGPPPPEAILDSLDKAAKIGILSKIQVALLRDRCADSRTWTYAALKAKYGISRDESVRKCLTRTAKGLYWDRAMEGGKDPYLSVLDWDEFRQVVLAPTNSARSCPVQSAGILAPKRSGLVPEIEHRVKSQENQSIFQ